VAQRLRAAGHEIYTPTLTGLGERVHLVSPDVTLSTHIEDIVNVLEFEDLRDVVLVGHSYAGMVITGVAERVPARLAGLVYVDAYVPENGQRLTDLLPPELLEELVAQAAESGVDWLLPHDSPDAPRRTDFPIAAGLEPLAVTNPDAARLSRAYIACVERIDHPLYSHFAEAAARAQREGWDYFELPTGHRPMETMPEELTAILGSFA
jgi:pimeloyl-ACP methyl ester carboxylesterase